jgi:hypothetical protein
LREGLMWIESQCAGRTCASENGRGPGSPIHRLLLSIAPAHCCGKMLVSKPAADERGAPVGRACRREVLRLPALGRPPLRGRSTMALKRTGDKIAGVTGIAVGRERDPA